MGWTKWNDRRDAYCQLPLGCAGETPAGAIEAPHPRWIAGRGRRAVRLVRKWLVYPRTRYRLSMDATRE